MILWLRLGLSHWNTWKLVSLMTLDKGNAGLWSYISPLALSDSSATATSRCRSSSIRMILVCPRYKAGERSVA